MNRTNLRLVCAISLLVVLGCSKDAEIDAFITEFDATTQEIVSKIDSNPTAAGVDDAQKTFDAKKASLKSKWDGIKDAVGFQVSDDAKKKLGDSVAQNMKSLMDVSMKNAVKMATDKNAAAKFQTLLKDYQATFTPPSK